MSICVSVLSSSVIVYQRRKILNNFFRKLVKSSIPVVKTLVPGIWIQKDMDINKQHKKKLAILQENDKKKKIIK